MTEAVRKPKLIRNAARCIHCDTIIESKHVHDFVTCPCGALHVDGGLTYLKRGWITPEGTSGCDDPYEELSEYDSYPENP